MAIKPTDSCEINSGSIINYDDQMLVYDGLKKTNQLQMMKTSKEDLQNWDDRSQSLDLDNGYISGDQYAFRDV